MILTVFSTLGSRPTCATASSTVSAWGPPLQAAAAVGIDSSVGPRPSLGPEARQRDSSCVLQPFHGDQAPPDGTIVNRAVGVVRTAGGKRWVVCGQARLTLSPEFSVDHVAFKIRGRR